MGTPNLSIYTDSKINLPGYSDKFTKYPPVDLRKIVPVLDADGINLLQQLLEYNPIKRITAIDALKHVRYYQLNLSHILRVL